MQKCGSRRVSSSSQSWRATDVDSTSRRLEKYLKAVESRLRDRLLYGKLSTVPPVSAPTVLRQIGSQELPERDDRTPAPVPPPAPRPVAVFEAEDGAARAQWVLLFIDRVVVGVVPRQELAIDVGEPRTYRKEDVRFRALVRLRDRFPRAPLR